MKVKPNAQILDLENKPVVDGERELLLKDVIVASLNNPLKGDELKASDKYDYYVICKKVTEQDEVDLSVEERGAILKRAAVMFSPLVYGRTKDLLEE